MSLKRFGVSLEDNLLESLDQYVNENGFANRSQAIRFLVERTWLKRNGSATILWRVRSSLCTTRSKKKLLPGLPISNKIIRMLSCLLPNIM